MHHTLQLVLTPEEAAHPEVIRKKASEALALSPDEITALRIVRKSIDARSQRIKVNLSVEIYWKEAAPQLSFPDFSYPFVGDKPPVLVIGAGPAGLFASLKLIELGFKPILLERGKRVRARKVDIAQINRNKGMQAESNYCFGEGGAGTFSDGKLYTRSKKKGNVQNILNIFHYHGANENILYEAHPHIGSDKLPAVVTAMVKTITDSGGEVFFEKKLTDILWDDAKNITGCKTSDGESFEAKALILASGHSAQDVYQLLHDKAVRLEAKGFAMGVRVEHPQELIDRIQYHSARSEYLPAASYNLVQQVEGRGVYSFCMCPGGHIVPAGSGPEEIVVNGMSASHRNSPYANSGIVVEIRPEDIPAEFSSYGVLAGLKFQQHFEQLAYRNNGGQGLKAPAQALEDFVKGRVSTTLPPCSYLPGIISSPLHFWIPEFISGRLREAFKLFDRKMKGYLTNDAVILGVESRSSSALRIPRNPETGQHPDVGGLFPCGEGSGYSGGITSSAIDGEYAATAAAAFLNNLEKERK